ncbi:MAG: MFS transporter [Acetobacteraceae bacterium]
MTLSRTTRVNLLIGNGHFLSHFYSLSLPPVFLLWQKAFDVSFAELGLAIAFMSGTTALLQTPVGFLVDRHGARPFLIGGTLLMSLSIAAMGLATSFWQVLALAMLSGVGNSVIHPCDYAIISGSAAPERIGRSFALHTFAGNLGFSAAPPVVAVLMLTIGWRGALIVVGLLGVPVVAAMVLQSGILTDLASERRHGHAPGMTGRQLLFGRTMILFLMFFALGSMGGAGVQAWLVTVLHATKGLSLQIASTALTAYMLGATTGVLVGGWYIESHKDRLLGFTVATTAVSAALVLTVNWLALPVVLTIGVMFAAGLALGTTRTPRDLMVKEAAPPGQIGKVFGFVSAGLPLGGALTPAPCGWLIDRGHPELVLVLVAVFLLLGLLCCGAARSSSRRVAVAVAAE